MMLLLFSMLVFTQSARPQRFADYDEDDYENENARLPNAWVPVTETPADVNTNEEINSIEAPADASTNEDRSSKEALLKALIRDHYPPNIIDNMNIDDETYKLLKEKLQSYYAPSFSLPVPSLLGVLGVAVAGWFGGFFGGGNDNNHARYYRTGR